MKNGTLQDKINAARHHVKNCEAWAKQAREELEVLENQVDTVLLRVEFYNECLKVYEGRGIVRALSDSAIKSDHTLSVVKQFILMRITEIIFDVDFNAVMLPPKTEDDLGIYEFRATTNTAEAFIRYVDKFTK